MNFNRPQVACRIPLPPKPAFKSVETECKPDFSAFYEKIKSVLSELVKKKCLPNEVNNNAISIAKINTEYIIDQEKQQPIRRVSIEKILRKEIEKNRALNEYEKCLVYIELIQNTDISNQQYLLGFKKEQAIEKAFKTITDFETYLNKFRDVVSSNHELNSELVFTFNALLTKINDYFEEFRRSEQLSKGL